MDKTYSYGKQYIDDDDIRAVVETLKGDWLTQGPAVQKFENLLAESFGSKNACAVSNGTASLHLIALALGWQKGDIVITSPITFLASANCAIYAGAVPDFVDIDESTYTLNTDKLEEKLKHYASKNKKVKAVIAVDYAGHPCNWEKLKSLQEKFGFQLINDFCHAPGAEYNGDFKYAPMYADAVNMSFHPVKHITTGEGGAALSNNSELDNRIRTLRTHGMTKDESVLEKNDGPWYYEMHEVGFNYRITDFQCALGLTQLTKLNSFVEKRREVAKHYDEALAKDNRIILPFVASNVKHAYHLYPLQIKFDEIGITRKDYFTKLRANRIFAQVHYVPVHLQPFYRKNFYFKPGDFPIAEKFYEREISIPMYPMLDKNDLEYISTKLIDCLG